jgi:adenine-specific DNA-methyltransferase
MLMIYCLRFVVPSPPSGYALGRIVKNNFYRGVTTGLNKAFIISNEKRKELIVKDNKSAELIFPYVPGKEIKRYRIEWKGKYILFTRRGINISDYPAIYDHLKNFKEELTPTREDEKSNIDEPQRKTITRRKPGNYKWYEIQDSTDYWKLFMSEAIVYPHFNEPAWRT